MTQLDRLRLAPDERRLANEYLQIGNAVGGLVRCAWALLEEAGAALRKHVGDRGRTWPASGTS